MVVKLEKSWANILKDEMGKDYFKELKKFIKDEYNNNTVYPPSNNMFNAFNLTPFNKLKVVILGQDPYHGPNQAHGLSFSVNRGINPPPSLKNIYKELHSDLGIKIPTHGNLTKWAKQGVLLLNAILTVQHKSPGSHKNVGWQEFTDAVIKTISDKKERVVFMLWGNFAKSKKILIDESKHLIIESAHPSPYSADKGFFNSKPFSKTNNYLVKHGNDPIDWSLD